MLSIVAHGSATIITLLFFLQVLELMLVQVDVVDSVLSFCSSVCGGEVSPAAATGGGGVCSPVLQGICLFFLGNTRHTCLRLVFWPSYPSVCLRASVLVSITTIDELIRN